MRSIEKQVSDILVKIQNYKFDHRGLIAYQKQIINHLQHVTFDLHVKEGSKTYPHKMIREKPFPKTATILALNKANVFINIIEKTYIPPQISLIIENNIEIYAQQEQTILENILKDPFNFYIDRIKHIKKDINTSFPEFLPLTKKMFATVAYDKNILNSCKEYAWLENMRLYALSELEEVLKNKNICPYQKTINAVENSLEFLDIFYRTIEEMPDLYHSHRYQYYKDFLLNQNDNIMFITSCPLSPTDLLKVRSVPVSFIGCNTKNERVDGFEQTPYEFFHHDINHSRRMFQFFIEAAENKNMNIEDYAKECTQTFNNLILPLLDKDKLKSEKEIKTFKAVRMILFEILHEDALPVDTEIIEQALFRKPLELTPFEYIDRENMTVNYIMEPGATTLAYTFRKLFHTFYDTPEHRYKGLGDEMVRSRRLIVDAAVKIHQTITNSKENQKQLMNTFVKLITTDQGFPEDFFNEVLKDIEKRNNHTTNFIVVEPKTYDNALQDIKNLNKEIVTVFGYSALKYQNDEELEKLIVQDLKNFDPKQTAILTGATEIGIGTIHNIAKTMGFETIGVVSTISLLSNYQYSKYVDHLHIIDDEVWGGNHNGQLSNTSKVFINSAYQIYAYGGGNITKDCIQEAKSKKIPVYQHILKPKNN